MSRKETPRYTQLLRVLNKALDASVDVDSSLLEIRGCFTGLPGGTGAQHFNTLSTAMLRELRKNIESEFHEISTQQELRGMLRSLDRQSGVLGSEEEEEEEVGQEQQQRQAGATAGAASGTVAIALCEARTRMKASEVERLRTILREIQESNERAAVDAEAQRAAVGEAARRVGERGDALRDAVAAAR